MALRSERKRNGARVITNEIFNARAGTERVRFFHRPNAASWPAARWRRHWRNLSVVMAWKTTEL